MSIPANKTAIYVLCDPEEPGLVRYVGKAKDPVKRLQSHAAPSSRNRTRVAAWCRVLKARGAKPVMTTLEWTYDWESAEVRWIAHFRSCSANLLNTDDGGIGSWAVGAKRPSRAGRRQFAEVMIKASKLAKQRNNPELLKAANAIRKMRNLVGAKRGEDALQRFDEELYRDVFNRTPDGKLICDASAI